MKNNLKKNLLYNIFYQMLAIVTPLLTTPYVSRVLGSEGVGRFSYSYAIAYYFVIFSMLGINNYGNRTIALVRDDFKKRSETFWQIYSIQLISSVVMTFFYIIYVVLLGKDQIVEWMLLIYVLSAVLDINWFFFGMEQFQITVIRNSIVKLITIFSIFLFVKSSQDIYLYVFINVIGAFVPQIILWVMLLKYVTFEKQSLSNLKVHIKPILMLFIPIIAVTIYKFTAKIMLGAMTSVEEVGYFESTDKIIQVPVALITALGTVMLPRISNMIANHKIEESLNYIQKSLVLSIVLVTPMSMGIMAISKEFVPIFYGLGFEKCVTIFQIVMPSCLFLAFANVIRTQYLIPHQKDKVYIISVLCGAIINLGVNFILIPKYQSIGAGVGTLCAEATVCIIQCYIVRREVPILRSITYSLPFIALSFLMYVTLVSMKLANVSTLTSLLVKVVVGAIIYSLGSVIILFLSHRKGIKMLT